MLSSLFILGSLLIGAVHCQPNAATIRLCNAQTVCRDCIFASPECIWCADTISNGTRCYANGDLNFQGCSNQQNPTGRLGATVEPELRGFNQVSPTRVEITVRPGQPQKFNLNVRPARNFPIDLYLLMDLSYSMRDDLANLQNLGTQIVNSIEGLSTNYSIGFGSFVEKRLSPFASLNPAILDNPCLGVQGITCQPTYSYRHIISLTNNSDLFRQEILAQTISGNQDLPEGGFDGFLQSILCTNLIGWREVSRKLLLFITDAGFHIAGDGKLGGVILPHRSICSLPDEYPPNVDRVEYEDAEIYDYPSIGQIAQALRDQDIIPIFAAESRVTSVYNALASELGDGAFTGVLETDSSNVVVLVEQLYNTISQRVIFDQDPIPGVSVTARATLCPGGFIEDDICTGLEIERNATIEITVSINECTPDLTNNNITIPVRVIGFGTFEIVLTAICQCNCELTREENNVACNGNGTLSCGQCFCNPGNFGDRCQCDASNQGSSLTCPLGENNIMCTDRGSCVCGECNCQSSFFGPVCECDEQGCVNQGAGRGDVCTGRGTCGCDGQCMCNVEPVSQISYFGQFCECTPNTQNCRDPSNRTSICNGRGTCGCDGSCACESSIYFGQYCELCSGSTVCSDFNCQSNQACADCAVNIIAVMDDMLTAEEFFIEATVNSSLPAGSVFSFNQMNNAFEIMLPLNHCNACSNGVVIINGTERADYEIDGEMAVRCETIRDGCNYRYLVAIDDATNNFTAVHVEYTRSCPQPALATAPWIIAISILIPLLILGLLLLILLKIILLVVDYIEVRKFEKELANTKYAKNENPLYKSATKDYQNPMYGQ